MRSQMLPTHVTRQRRHPIPMVHPIHKSCSHLETMVKNNGCRGRPPGQEHIPGQWVNHQGQKASPVRCTDLLWCCGGILLVIDAEGRGAP